MTSTADARRTVGVALAANVAIAGAKLAGAAATGSAALVAEAAHSIADCANEVFLLVALRASRRRPSALHPFGYGKDRFFWSLMAAVSTFLTGGIVAITHGLNALSSASHAVDQLPLALGILAVAFVADGASATQAIRHLRRDSARAGHRLRDEVRRGVDPTARTVLLEDAAALLGVCLAATGLGLHALTGSGRWDALASIAVGLLLTGVAVAVGAQSRTYLLGAAASPDQRRLIEAVLVDEPGIAAVGELLTMRTGVDSILVAVRVDLDDGLDAASVERLADRVEARLRAAVPDVTEVFLDPSSTVASTSEVSVP